MVKLFFNKPKSPSTKKNMYKPEKSDSNDYLFFIYIQWSQENRELKTYMRTKKLKSEIDMVCNGLSDLVANPEMKLNNKNIKMAILYQLDDASDDSLHVLINESSELKKIFGSMVKKVHFRSHK